MGASEILTVERIREEFVRRFRLPDVSRQMPSTKGLLLGSTSDRSALIVLHAWLKFAAETGAECGLRNRCDGQGKIRSVSNWLPMLEPDHQVIALA